MSTKPDKPPHLSILKRMHTREKGAEREDSHPAQSSSGSWLDVGKCCEFSFGPGGAKHKCAAISDGLIGLAGEQICVADKVSHSTGLDSH